MAYASYVEVLNKAVEIAGGREKLTVEQLRKLATIKIQLAEKERGDPLSFYKPYESRLVPGRYPQRDFHASAAKVRMLCGGNRSGKSEGGFVEDVFWTEGRHPYRKLPVPNHGWVVSLSFKKSTEVTEPKLRRWLTPSKIKHWDTVKGLITLTNGSTIGLKSCDQDIEDFGGKALHWVHVDEEPPGMKGRKIYDELMMRLIDYRGCIWFTMTPVSGMSWTYDEIVERSVFDKDIAYFEMNSYENPHIPLDELKRTERKLSPDEIEMRIKGKYIQFSGLVLREFSKDLNLIEPLDAAVYRGWPKFRGLDHGINKFHPTACVWVAVSPQEEYYVYDEYKESDKIISDNCVAIKQITGSDRIEWTAIDPATDARDPQTGLTNRAEYRRNGVFARALKTDKNAGIMRLRQLLAPDTVTKRPRLYIFKTCHNLIQEICRYRWRDSRGTVEQGSREVVKMNDDLVDALRYCIMSNPRYDLECESEEYIEPAPWYGRI